MSTENDFESVQLPLDEIKKIEDDGHKSGGHFKPNPAHDDAVGFTHFDSYKNSEESMVTVLLTKEKMEDLPLQAVVRIKSEEDSRSYIGTVVSGPYAEPDGLSPESSLLIATTIQGKVLQPRYHGRAFIEVLGEEYSPKRFAPVATKISFFEIGCGLSNKC